MAQVYTYKKTQNVSKKINGHYDAQTHIITTDEGDYNLLQEMADFDDKDISFNVSEKSEEDLAE